MPCVDQIRYLVAKVAAVAEPAMQQDDRAAGAIARVPDTRAIVVDKTLLVRRGQSRGAVRIELFEIVVGRQAGQSLR